MKSNPTTEAVHKFIESYHAEHHKSPTMREIAAACFIATGSVIRHLDRLEMSGYIQREPNQARSIVLLKVKDST